MASKKKDKTLKAHSVLLLPACIQSLPQIEIFVINVLWLDTSVYLASSIAGGRDDAANANSLDDSRRDIEALKTQMARDKAEESEEGKKAGKVEKEKEELEAELESLSQALFEANNMVATERRLRAETESKLQRQQQDLKEELREARAKGRPSRARYSQSLKHNLSRRSRICIPTSRRVIQKNLIHIHNHIHIRARLPNVASNSRRHRDLGRGRQDVQDAQTS
ncbi:MAG: hypothetical protein NXY57DRAFT_1041906 [Lentinula lateritia]|nr:MAG: hypothetical protein NXY57DRAFT_1041906 [Lentinula lateritia]